MSTSNYKAPGRLGDSSLNLTTEPRINPRLLKILTTLGLEKSNPLPLPGTSVDQLRPLIAGADEAFSTIYKSTPLDLPSDVNEPTVSETTETFKSFDGVERTLYIFRREDTKDQAPPAILYSHGGGMTILPTKATVHFRWARSLAIEGAVAIVVDFRNAYTPEGDNPYPIGQNDCAAALRHVHANRQRLGIGKIILEGESGGGNLAITTALKAKREGFIDAVAGVYAVVPFISNGYLWSDERKIAELPSLYECDGYFIENNFLGANGHFYSPNDLENPHAWPYHSSVEDLKGLPPHALSMDELDPLRDEGLAFHRKLLAAGVQTSARVNAGIVHGSAVIYRQAIPEFHNALVRDIVAFAKSL